METGMLWFDNYPKTDLAGKVLKAAAYYRNKYGIEPNVCCAHPSMVVDKNAETRPITLISTTTVLPDHFWIGVQQPLVVDP